MATMRKLAVGLIILAALAGCELAGERGPAGPSPEEPTLTAKPLCVKECAKANDSCVAEAARELLECVQDMSEPPVCSDCILMCHIWFEQAVQGCNAVASRCTEDCLSQ